MNQEGNMKKSQLHIVLSEDQIAQLIYSSVGNIVNIRTKSNKKDNTFKIDIILNCVLPDEFPQKDKENIQVEDYEPADFYLSHMAEPFIPFTVGIFRALNPETREKQWGVNLEINPENCHDFVVTLDTLKQIWGGTFGQSKETVSKPSKGSIVVQGNDTVN